MFTLRDLNFKKCFFVALTVFVFNSYFSQTTYYWHGTTNVDWATASNWSTSSTTPSVGSAVPTTSSHVVIINRTNQPVLDQARTITNFTLTSGTLDLNTFALTISGTATFTAGAANNGSILKTSTGTAVFGDASGGPTIGANINLKAGALSIRNTTFNGITTLEKTGTSNENCVGNNTFNGITSIIKSGTSGNWLFGSLTRDIFNNDVTISNGTTGSLSIAANSDGSGATEFNGNLVLNNTNTGGIAFGQGAVVNSGITGGTSVLASGKTLSTGTWSSTGSLFIRNFTQLGSGTTHTIILAGTTNTLNLQQNSTWNGTVNFKAPQVSIASNTFNGTTTIEKSGATANSSTGNNTFNGLTYIANSGSGQFNLANSTRDIFNNDVTISNSGTGAIQLAINNDATGATQFNGNVILNNTNTGGITFGLGAIVTSGITGGTSILASGKTLSTGTWSSTGSLTIRNFTQLGTGTSHTLNLAGTTNLLNLQRDNTWNGTINFKAPQVAISSNTFNGPTTIEKSGAGNNNSGGNNTFNEVTNIKNSGSGQFNFAFTQRDIFNNDLTISNSGTANIQLAINNDATGATQFNGNVTFNCSSTGGITFGQGTTVTSGITGGTSILASEKTLSIGASGWTSTGSLTIRNFTQLGSGTTHSLILAGTTNFLNLQQNNTWNGTVVFKAPQIALTLNTFNGETTLEKTGATVNSSAGNNVFNNTTTIKNSGTNSFIFSNVTRDIFNNDLILTTTNTGIINLANNNDASGGTQFSGNILFNIASTGGISFGGGSGTSSLIAGKTIAIGSSGYSGGGTISFRNFTYNDTAPLTIATPTNLTSFFNSTNSYWNCAVSVTAGRISTTTSTYNGNVYFEKSGNFQDNSGGGNVFNGTVHLYSTSNFGGGGFVWGRGSGDTFNYDLTITIAGTAQVYLSRDGTGTTPLNNFNGNINFNLLNPTANVIFGGKTASGASILAAGKTINISNTSVNGPSFTFFNFSNLGTVPVDFSSLDLYSIQMNKTVWNAPLQIKANDYFRFINNVFNNSTVLERTGAFDGQNIGAGPVETVNGGNTYNGLTEIKNTGTGGFYTTYADGDIYNNDVTFTTTSGYIGIGLMNGTGIGNTKFNGNVFVNSTSTTGGVLFGDAIPTPQVAPVLTWVPVTLTGTTALADGKTISVGSLGFSAGELRIKNLTQTGTTPQTLLLTGSGKLTLDSTNTWNGPVDFSAPILSVSGNTFNNTASLETSGDSTTHWDGGNIYYAATTIKNSGSGDAYIGDSLGDTFNGDVTFVRRGTGVLYPAYNTNTSFKKNVSVVGSTSPVQFAMGPNGLATFNGTVAQELNNGISDPSPEFKKLQLLNTAGLNLNTSVLVTDSLLMHGGDFVLANTKMIEIGTTDTTTGVISWNSGSIIGPLKRWFASSTNPSVESGIFPIGKVGLNRYAQVNFTTAPSVGGYIIAQFVEGLPIDNYASLPLQYTESSSNYYVQNSDQVGYWDITPYSAAGVKYGALDDVAYTLKLRINNPTSVENGGILANPPQVRLIRAKGNADGSHDDWSLAGTHTSISAITEGEDYLVTSSSVVGFSWFNGGGNNANPLPVELLNFNAEKNNRLVDISWQTASEHNNDYFTVERSADGYIFETISIVKGAENSNELLSYISQDLQPLEGVSYYRLKQTDLDGAVEYSDIRVVKMDGTSDITIYPNPSSSNVMFVSTSTGIESMRIVSSDGRLVFKQDAIENSFELSLKPGVYFVTSTVEGKQQTKKIIFLDKN